MASVLARAFVAASALFLAAFPAAAQEEAGEFAFTQDYDPQPAMWRLADEDTTIYLLGTVHALPEGFRWRNPRLDAIIEEADALVVETSDYDLPEDGVDVGGKLEARMLRRAATSSRLSPAAQEQWRALIDMTGMEYGFIDNMPVLMGLLTMGMSGGGADASSTLYGVETVLEDEFIRRDRPIVSIEDSGEVMYSLLRQDTDELVSDLDARLQAWQGKNVRAFFNEGYVDAAGDAYWTAEHDWARGVVADEFNFGFGEGAIGRAFDAMLLDRRNGNWAVWLDERLDSPGTILVAVGAGHFEGDVSLLAKLRERGLTATRLN